MSEVNILIVDDERDIVDILVKKIMLHSKGKYNLWVATDGLEAVDLLRKYPMDVLVLDIMMRNLDGHGVVREMAKEGRLQKTQVIISSANLTDEIEDQMVSVGVNHFLHKPYSLESLVTLIDQVLKNDSSQH